jgi:hypothetical protein
MECRLAAWNSSEIKDQLEILAKNSQEAGTWIVMLQGQVQITCAAGATNHLDGLRFAFLAGYIMFLWNTSLMEDGSACNIRRKWT